MSGQPPYIYLAAGEALIDLGFDQLQYLYDATSLFIVPIGGYDLFEAGCAAALLSEPPSDEHGVRPYDIRYPYCRTALRYNMADIRGDPQIGQLVAQAPYVAIRIMLAGCDRSLPIRVEVNTQPQQAGCAAALYPGYDPTEFHAIIDTTIATLPLRLNFQVTNGNDVTKKFWIGVRDNRDGVPSGAVVPPRRSG